MKIKILELLEAEPAFKKIFNAPMEDFKVGYAVKRTRDVIIGELKTIYETKDDLIKKFGDEKDGNYIITPKSKNWKKYSSQFDKMAETEIEFEVWPIQIKAVEKAGLTINEIAAVEKFLEDVNETAPAKEKTEK